MQGKRLTNIRSAAFSNFILSKVGRMGGAVMLFPVGVAL